MRLIIETRKVVLFGVVLFSLILPLNASPFRKSKNRVCAQEFTDDSLKNRIFRSDKRFATFQYVLNLMSEREVKIIVETGTARNGECNCAGDGCSTPIWGAWAQKNGAYVYSVDIDPQAIQNSSDACTSYQDHIAFVTCDSVGFLANFDKSIDFLYLDSYDFDVNNPSPSQEHHLKEIMAVYPSLHKKSIIMIDDCDLPFGGKGKLVIQYLLDRGWKIALSGYQVILIYE